TWHGMTLGKNADAHPRASFAAERALLGAELLSTIAGLFGRPYASWDVYPTWELEEAWRNTLAAQHHDNHECEGLCGFVGHQQFETAQRMAAEVSGRAAWLLARRAGMSGPDGLVFNRLGWARTVALSDGPDHPARLVHVPPFGYAARPPAQHRRGAARTTVKRHKRSGTAILARGGFRVEVDEQRGCITRVGEQGEMALFGLRMTEGGSPVAFAKPKVVVKEAFEPSVLLQYATRGGLAEVEISLAQTIDAVDVAVRFVEEIGAGRPMKP